MRPLTFGKGISWTRSSGARSGALGGSCENPTQPRIDAARQSIATLFMFRSHLGQYVVDSQFGSLALVMRHPQIIAIQFRHQHCRLGTERGRDVPDLMIMVSIALPEHVNKLGACEIDAFFLTVVGHVINHRCTRQAVHHFARITVQNNQFSRIASAHKQPMTVLVERYRCRLLALLGNRPGRNQGLLCPIKHLYGVVPPTSTNKRGPDFSTAMASTSLES